RRRGIPVICRLLQHGEVILHGQIGVLIVLLDGVLDRRPGWLDLAVEAGGLRFVGTRGRRDVLGELVDLPQARGNVSSVRRLSLPRIGRRRGGRRRYGRVTTAGATHESGNADSCQD